MYSPRQLDQRSLALHRIAADKLRQDSTLLVKVQGILDHWLEVCSPRTEVYLHAWQAAVLQGVEACAELALEDSERAAALRQSSPLSCLLSKQERFAFLKQWSLQHASHGT